MTTRAFSRGKGGSYTVPSAPAFPQVRAQRRRTGIEPRLGALAPTPVLKTPIRRSAGSFRDRPCTVSPDKRPRIVLARPFRFGPVLQRFASRSSQRRTDDLRPPFRKRRPSAHG